MEYSTRNKPTKYRKNLKQSHFEQKPTIMSRKTFNSTIDINAILNRIQQEQDR